MALYDQFLNIRRSKWVSDFFIKNNLRLLNYLKKNIIEKKSVDILEIGPGQGYFLQACKLVGGFQYYAVDRSKNILNSLSISKDRCYVTELPQLYGVDRKFDVIFCGYVIEHLKNGIELYETLEKLKSFLKENGVLVLLFPNSMELGMELYNIDYTHTFPTTKRNVNQALIDSGMYIDKCIDLCGIGYVPTVVSSFLYKIKKTLVFFYSYKIMSFISYPFYRVPLYSLDNIWWRAYALIKEPNVLVIARKRM